MRILSPLSCMVSPALSPSSRSTRTQGDRILLRHAILRRLLLLLTLFSIPASFAAPLTPAWVFPPAGRIGAVSSSPTLFHSISYIGSDDGKLYALCATGPHAGTLVKGFPIALDGAVKGRPALYGRRGDERLYVTTTNGSLYAFHLDGRPAWAVNPQPLCPGDPITSTPAARGNYLYVTASTGRIFRRRVEDGADAGGLTYGRVVTTRTPRPQTLPPAQPFLEVADASSFFPSGRVRIASTDPFGDEVKQDYTYEGKDTASRPNRLLNVAPLTTDGDLIFHPKGSVVRGYGPGAAANASPAVPAAGESTLVVAALESKDGSPSEGRNLVALSSEDDGLVPRWEMSCGARITGAPLVDEATGILFFGAWNDAKDAAAGGRLYAVQAANGALCRAWSAGPLPLEGGVLQAGPWLDYASETLVFGTTSGALYLVRAADGVLTTPPRPMPGASAFRATPLVVRKTVYIGDDMGHFYAAAMGEPAETRCFTETGGAFNSSPSASGGTSGKDVVVVGSRSGKVYAFPVP